MARSPYRRSLAAAAALAVAAVLAGCSVDSDAPGTQRAVLLAPDFVAVAAATQTDDPQAKWILGQPESVRESYVHEVLDAGGDRDLRSTAWLLKQPDDVRESYVKDLVEPKLK